MKEDCYGPISGQIISVTKDLCLKAFMGCEPRLVQGLYLCTLNTDQQYYGKSYDVLNKRKSVIIEEYLQENSNIYIIKALLPVQESFGFYQEIYNLTSGRITA